MRKAFIAVLTCSVACGLQAGVASTATASASPRPTTISFTEHQVSDQTFHLGPKSGIAVGFVELVASDDMQGTTKLGHDGGSCTVTRLSEGTADELCDITFVLAGGQVDTAGLVTSTPSGPGAFRLAIVGGTGTYSTASGQATVVPAQAPTVTLRLAG